MNILFLNVNYVLNTKEYLYTDVLKNLDIPIDEVLIPEKVKYLKQIVDLKDFKIVLTSWKFLFGSGIEKMEELKRRFVSVFKDNQMEIIAITPDCCGHRPLEIYTFLLHNKDKIDEYFILDNDEYANSDYHAFGLSDYVFNTEYYTREHANGTGLTSDIINQILLLLLRNDVNHSMIKETYDLSPENIKESICNAKLSYTTKENITVKRDPSKMVIRKPDMKEIKKFIKDELHSLYLNPNTPIPITQADYYTMKGHIKREQFDILFHYLKNHQIDVNKFKSNIKKYSESDIYVLSTQVTFPEPVKEYIIGIDLAKDELCGGNK
jgi:hypothetical protein